jgi:hypothetical protein
MFSSFQAKASTQQIFFTWYLSHDHFNTLVLSLLAPISFSQKRFILGVCLHHHI